MKPPVSSQSITNPAALSAEDLRGVFLPIPTPFNSNSDVDVAGLRANIARWNTTGISGYAMLGSTGERVNLDETEYLDVVGAAREEVDRAEAKLTFIAGAGQQSTRGTVNEIKRVAAAVPVDAFLVITPHFYRSSITQPALIEHYQRVADESPASLILYSMPALTGIKIEPETVARLSEHENIIGIKDSSADIDGLRETVRLVPTDFAVLTGNGTVLTQALQAGARGGILAVGCVVPEVCLEILDAVTAGKTELASSLQTNLTPLAQAVTTRFGIGGLKAALEMKGYVGGGVRAPLATPSDEACEEIRRSLENLEVRDQKSEIRSDF